MSVVLVVYGSMCRVCERVTWSYVMMKDVMNTLVQSGHDQMSINTHNRTRYWDFSVFSKTRNPPWVSEIFRNSMVPRTGNPRVAKRCDFRRNLYQQKSLSSGYGCVYLPNISKFFFLPMLRRIDLVVSTLYQGIHLVLHHALCTHVLGTIEFLKISKTHGLFSDFSKTEKSQ